MNMPGRTLLSASTTATMVSLSISPIRSNLKPSTLYSRAQ